MIINSATTIYQRDNLMLTATDTSNGYVKIQVHTFTF